MKEKKDMQIQDAGEYELLMFYRALSEEKKLIFMNLVHTLDNMGKEEEDAEEKR